MKKKFRLTALLVALMVFSVSVFTACGGSSGNNDSQKEPGQAAEQEAQAPAETEPSESDGTEEAAPQAQADSAVKPSAEDAQAYVKAMLDLMCTGTYDHSVNMADIVAGEETALRDDTIASTVAAIGGDAGLSEELQSDFAEVLKESFSKCRYTVGDAVPAEDGGYDVTVSIEPLKIYSGAEERLKEKLSSQDVSGLTEEEKTNLVYTAIIEIIRENLEEPAYSEPREVVVHYGLLDEANNAYGLTEEEGKKLGELLFSADME